MLISAENQQQLSAETKELYKSHDYLSSWDREKMKNQILEAVNVAKKTGLQLFCGEWGAYERTPRPVAYAWMRDLISIFDELDISFTCWGYAGDFGFFDYRTKTVKDQQMLEILLSGKVLK